MTLFRAFATVGGMTMISRILGFIRDILIAAALGTGIVADAFFVAFRFPNLFRRLFAEGAFNAAFIPLFAKRLQGEGHEEARKFAEEALAVLVFALLILTAVAEFAMPWLMYGLAWGFADTPEEFDLSVVLTRITFPYLLFVSLLALFSGILNAFQRFAAAAAAPVLLNIVFIAVLSWISFLGLGNTPEAGYYLAWGVSAAGLLQFLVVLFAARSVGMVLRLRMPRLTPGIVRLLRLGGPGLLAGGATQINIIIGTIIASLQDGAVSWLYYADRLYQLPLGIVGIAIGVVLLPDLSAKLRAGDKAAVNESQNRSLEFSLLLTIPAAVALFVLPEPLIRVLFERGAFTTLDTVATAQALGAFALGLPAFVLIKVFSPGYFAREDTKTPMIYAGIGMIVNVICAIVLFFVIGHVGIAVATSIAGWLNAGLLAMTLIRRGHFDIDDGLRRRMPLILISSLTMGAGLWLAALPLASWLGPDQGIIPQTIALAVLISAGLAVFVAALQVTGAAHLPSLMRSLIARK